MTPAFCTVLLIGLRLLDSQAEEFPMSPTNQAVVAGGSVLFECQLVEGVIDEFEWYYGSDAITAGQTVRPKYKDRVNLLSNSSTRRYNIEMNNVVLDDSKQFRCADTSSASTAAIQKEAFAQLFVLKEKPFCNSDKVLTDLLEGEDFRVTCEANYRAMWEAGILCEDSNSLEIPTSNVGSGPGKLLSFIEIKAVDRLQSGQLYKFTINFPTPPAGVLPDDSDAKKYSREAPGYTFVHSTDILNVQFPVEKLAIPGLKPGYSPGERITCEAEGNPAPTFYWLQQHQHKKEGFDITPLDSSVLVIDKSMEGANVYQCEAENWIKSVTYSINKTVKFTVTTPTTQPPPTTTTTTHLPLPATTPAPGLNPGAIAGIVIGSLFGLLIIAVLVFIIVFRNMTAKTTAKKMKEPLSVPQRLGGSNAQVHTNTHSPKVLPESPLPAGCPPDDLRFYLEDNQAGSRKPLPANEYVGSTPANNNWI